MTQSYFYSKTYFDAQHLVSGVRGPGRDFHSASHNTLILKGSIGLLRPPTISPPRGSSTGRVHFNVETGFLTPASSPKGPEPACLSVKLCGMSSGISAAMGSGSFW